MESSNDATFQSQPDQARHTERPRTMKIDKDDQLQTDSSGAMQPKELMDVTLQFLSTSSNERLLFVVACLMGATYVLLGRIGLLLIGIIFGIALHASWEGSGNGPSSEAQSSSRRQLSLNIVHRLLDWQSSQRPEPDQDRSDVGEKVVDHEADMELDTSTFGPATTSALQSLINAVIEDYVNYWYKPILPSESTFPLSCRRTMVDFITSISSHLCRKRTADTFLEFLTNSSSVAIVFLNELSTAFEAADPAIPSERTILRYLESNPESSLSSLLANQQQHKKLITISDDMLSRFLDPKAYNCIPLRNFLREILAGVVFESAISSLSRPEFINGWIIYLFSEGESEIMSAIDAGVEGARTHGVTAASNAREANRPASILADNSTTESDLSSKAAKKEPSETDKATEDAMREAKRLSAMIAAQNLQKYSDPRTSNDVHGETVARGRGDSVVNSNTESGTMGRPLSGSAAPGDGPAGKEEDVHKAGPEASDSYISGTLASSPSPYSSGAPPASLPSENSQSSQTSSLHRASITVDDGMDSGDKAPLRSKPTSNYLLQVEPLSGRCSGWMLFRKYADFESIHETLVTISRLNQLRGFTDSHPVLPRWKGRTRQALARDLERYLRDALQFEALAESITMRRFLEKDGGLSVDNTDSPSKPGFVFPGQVAFESVGKGVLGGGKAVIEGVTGVFGGGVSKKTPAASRTGTGTRDDGGNSQKNEPPLKIETPSTDAVSLQSTNATAGAPPSQSPGSGNAPILSSPSSNAPTQHDRKSMDDVGGSASQTDFDSVDKSTMGFDSVNSSEKNSKEYSAESRTSTEATRPRSQTNPITADETRVAVELIFAVLNELYSLSSAWNIRRTLLNAAKTYILRPGNPSLETIRDLLQKSMIDNHTSDEAIGQYLGKLRENVLPSEEELASWPPEMSDVEKERQRDAARRVLVQKGLPQAITSVMGAAASREALGKVFDSLQVEVVARGFVFSILLQALRAVAL